MRLHEMLEFIEVSHGSYQHFNFLPHISLSTQYSILVSLIELLIYSISLNIFADSGTWSDMTSK